MSVLKIEQRKAFQNSYDKLRQLIDNRRIFENCPVEKRSELVKCNEIFQFYPLDELPNPTVTEIYFHNIDGWCLLHLAAALGDLETVKRLVEQEHFNVSMLQPTNNTSALDIALQYGNVTVARYLKNKGALINNNRHYLLNNEKALKFFDEETQAIIVAMKENLLIGLTNNNSAQINFILAVTLKYAAQINDNSYFEFINGLVNQGIIQLNSLYSELIHLALLNQHSDLALKLFYEYKDITLIEIESLFIAAISVDNITILEALVKISKQIDIDKQDNNGNTLLYWAIKANSLKSINYLIQKKANPLICNYNGQTIFHAQAQNNVKLPLFSKEYYPDLGLPINQRDYYGKLPRDINKGPIIAQSNIIEKLIYFHQLFYRDQSFINKEGYCNGLVFLAFSNYKVNNREIFFRILELIADWDGSNQSLRALPPTPITGYENCYELFETFISHITFFHATKLYELHLNFNQDDRHAMFEFMDKNLSYYFRNLSSVLHKAQLREILAIFNQFPEGTRFEVKGAKHVVGFEKVDNQFSYYDPNFLNQITIYYDIDLLLQIIIETKYNGLLSYLDEYEQSLINNKKYSLEFLAYQLLSDNFLEYNYFKFNELPKSCQEAQDFIDNSPNQLSYLCIAILSNSKNNVIQLLKDNYCQIEHKNSFGLSALDTAIKSQNIELCTILLNHIDKKVSIPWITLYSANKGAQRSFYLSLIAHAKVTKLNNLFKNILVFNQQDNESIALILSKNCIKLKDNNIHLIIKYFTSTFFQTAKLLFDYFKDSKTETGETLMLYATKQGNQKAMEYLLNNTHQNNYNFPLFTQNYKAQTKDSLPNWRSNSMI